MKKGKILLAIIAAGILIGGIVAYRMWNKPHEKAEDAQGTVVTTQVLAEMYTNNEAKANELYLDKWLQVNGTVSELTTNQDGKLVIAMDNGIQCTMRDAGTKAESGKIVTIKGKCSGNDMFGVLLSDCIIVN